MAKKTNRPTVQPTRQPGQIAPIARPIGRINTAKRKGMRKTPANQGD
ncbi:MAG: hypothetical protein AABW64_00740 [Nanoarchaeota archaeon]